MPHADPWRFAFSLPVTGRLLCLPAVVAPGVGEKLAGVVLGAAQIADRLGFERQALRATGAVFGMEYFRGLREEAGSLRGVLRACAIGGDTQIGDRVVFLGSNTLGSLDERGYPRVGNDVIIGAGARILGPVTIGDGARIGANAVVLCDVPAGATATGVPAVVRTRGVPAGVPATSEPR